MTDEEWRPVVGFEGYYEVSSLGRVRSAYKGGRVLSQGTPGKYCQVSLVQEGKIVPALAHRLVAEAFIPNPDNLPWVLHWDDDKSNNRVENLRWGTASDNEKDKVRNGNNSNAQKTCCPRGHPYDRDNGRNRRCSICDKEKRKSRRGEEPPEHGNVTGFSNYGCRCSDCVSGYARDRGVRLRKEPPNHGTQNGYNNYGCRCAPCKEAHREYNSEFNRVKLQEGQISHGTRTGYFRGCRCGPCSRVQSEYQREYRNRKKIGNAE